MSGSKTVLKWRPRDRLFSHEALRRKMSEVLWLRERVAQAELRLSIAAALVDDDGTDSEDRTQPPRAASSH
jgi:hypothetical protein